MFAKTRKNIFLIYESYYDTDTIRQGKTMFMLDNVIKKHAGGACTWHPDIVIIKP